MTSRRWVFTLNNYTAAEQYRIAQIFESDAITYGIYGIETGSNGTPHLQGFVILPRAQRLSWLRNRLSPRGHYERALGSSAQCVTYCKKDGNFVEFGELPTEQGRRGDIDAFIAWGDEFIATNGRAPTSPEIAQERPAEYTRFPRATNLFAHRAPPPVLQEGQANAWQQALHDEMEAPPSPRSVIFYVDVEGGKGKTWFQQWYLTKYPRKTQVLTIGKRDDIAYMIDQTKSVFFFNIPRGGMEFLQYTILEQLKDRMVSSCKYVSRMKYLVEMPHVIVFSNEEPDMNKMSQDRYDIRYV